MGDSPTNPETPKVASNGASNTDWKPIPGYRVRCRPTPWIQQAAAWLLFGLFFSLWLYFAGASLFGARRDPDKVAFAIGIPIFVYGMHWFMKASGRWALAKLHTLAELLDIDAYCHYGPPMWHPTFPFYTGYREGHAINIDFYGFKQTHEVTLSIRGPNVELLTEPRLKFIQRETGVTPHAIARDGDRIEMVASGNLTQPAMQKWLVAIVDLVGEGPKRA